MHMPGSDPFGARARNASYDYCSYATGSGGHNRIDMKTNIKAKSSVMFTANIEGA